MYKIFILRLKQHRIILNAIFVVYYIPMTLVILQWDLKFLFATKFPCGYCVYMYFNFVQFLHCAVFNRCTYCNLFTWPNKIIWLSMYMYQGIFLTVHWNGGVYCISLFLNISYIYLWFHCYLSSLSADNFTANSPQKNNLTRAYISTDRVMNIVNVDNY